MRKKMPEVVLGELSPQEKLILLMQGKEGVLVENGFCVPGEYFNDEDAEDLAQWSDARACRVWIVTKLHYASGLRADTCPWCKVPLTPNPSFRCPGCGYGERHGVCTLANSCNTWGGLMCRMYKANDTHSDYHYLPYDFYTELLSIIDSIETGKENQ